VAAVSISVGRQSVKRQMEGLMGFTLAANGIFYVTSTNSPDDL